MKPELELTEDEIQALIDQWNITPGGVTVLLHLCCAKLNAKLPELPEPARWIPVSERMPTEADTHDLLQQVVAISYNGLISGVHWDAAGFKNGHFLAWQCLPAYAPAVPTPEQISRKEFEAWVNSTGQSGECRAKREWYIDSLMPRQWDAWQAARASKGGAS